MNTNPRNNLEMCCVRHLRIKGSLCRHRQVGNQFTFSFHQFGNRISGYNWDFSDFRMMKKGMKHYNKKLINLCNYKHF